MFFTAASQTLFLPRVLWLKNRFLGAALCWRDSQGAGSLPSASQDCRTSSKGSSLCLCKAAWWLPTRAEDWVPAGSATWSPGPAPAALAIQRTAATQVSPKNWAEPDHKGGPPLFPVVSVIKTNKTQGTCKKTKVKQTPQTKKTQGTCKSQLQARHESHAKPLQDPDLVPETWFCSTTQVHVISNEARSCYLVTQESKYKNIAIKHNFKGTAEPELAKSRADLSLLLQEISHYHLRLGDSPFALNSHFLVWGYICIYLESRNKELDNEEIITETKKWFKWRNIYFKVLIVEKSN